MSPRIGLGGIEIPGTLADGETRESIADATHESLQDREIAQLRARITALETVVAVAKQVNSLGPTQAEVAWAGARARGPAWALLALLTLGLALVVAWKLDPIAWLTPGAQTTHGP